MSTQPQSQNPVEMLATLIQGAKTQGFAVLLCLILAVVLWQRDEKNIERIKECQDEKVEILMKVVSENTAAITELSNAIKEK